MLDGSVFDIEITDLSQPRWGTPVAADPPIFPPPAASPLARRVPLRLRVARLLLTVCVLCLALPSLAPALPVALAAALAPSSAAPPVARFTWRAGITGGTVHTENAQDLRWTLLAQRDLHLPVLIPGAACPVNTTHSIAAGLSPALGSGPAYAIAAGGDNGTLLITSASALGLPGRDWGGLFVSWFFDPHYQGPVLIRGARLDGAGLVRFNGGLDQQAYVYNLPAAPVIPTLRLEADSGFGAPWPGWPSYTRLRAPGCYAYQVDGTSFSEVIVFKAVFEP